MKNLFYSVQTNIAKYFTQKNLLYFASLPLLVNWYFVLLFYYEDLILKKQAFRSALLSLVFFLMLFISWIFSKIPFLGALLGNLIHFSAILIYIGISFFLIYKIYMNQNLEIEVLDRKAEILERLFQ